MGFSIFPASVVESTLVEGGIPTFAAASGRCDQVSMDGRPLAVSSNGGGWFHFGEAVSTVVILAGLAGARVPVQALFDYLEGERHVRRMPASIPFGHACTGVAALDLARDTLLTRARSA
jgi:hypothetical protein